MENVNYNNANNAVNQAEIKTDVFSKIYNRIKNFKIAKSKKDLKNDVIYFEFCDLGMNIYRIYKSEKTVIQEFKIFPRFEYDYNINMLAHNSDFLLKINTEDFIKYFAGINSSDFSFTISQIDHYEQTVIQVKQGKYNKFFIPVLNTEKTAIGIIPKIDFLFKNEIAVNGSDLLDMIKTKKEFIASNDFRKALEYLNVTIPDIGYINTFIDVYACDSHRANAGKMWVSYTGKNRNVSKNNVLIPKNVLLFLEKDIKANKKENLDRNYIIEFSDNYCNISLENDPGFNLGFETSNENYPNVKAIIPDHHIDHSFKIEVLELKKGLENIKEYTNKLNHAVIITGTGCNNHILLKGTKRNTNTTDNITQIKEYNKTVQINAENEFNMHEFEIALNCDYLMDICKSLNKYTSLEFKFTNNCHLAKIINTENRDVIIISKIVL